jgi:tetratricopeptide (TPR) repeat protein
MQFKIYAGHHLLIGINNKMKKPFVCLFSIFTSFIISQNTYISIQSKIDETVSKYSDADENYKILSTIHKQFKKSKKVIGNSLDQNQIGIVAIINFEKKGINLFPAKFHSNNGLINISAFSLGENEASTADMNGYIERYLQRIEYIGNTETFKTLVGVKPEVYYPYAMNNDEHVIHLTEKSASVFLRSTDDWLFAVSSSMSDIRFYAFKLNLDGEDIFGDVNNETAIEKRRLEKIQKDKENKEKFPLYHDVRTDKIRTAIQSIAEFEPFKNDKKLKNQILKLDKPITRYNLGEFIEPLNYFYQLNITKAFLNAHFNDSEGDENYVKHLCIHALADYNSSQNNFDLAIDQYKKAIFESPYEVSSGTNVIKDIERVIYDLSKTCYKAGRKDEAYGYLIGLIIDSQNNSQLATKDIKAYMLANKEVSKQFKTDLDKALLTIQKGQDQFSRQFIFRKKTVFFYPMMPDSAEEYRIQFKETDFYKSL